MPVIGVAATLVRQPIRLARFAVQAVETVVRTLADQASPAPPPAPPPPRKAPPAPARRRPRSAEAPPAPASPVVPSEAKVVDDEPVLVEESAEPGAEDAAGPEIHIDEPFAGYSLLKAADVIGRVRAATGEEAAAINLYESLNKKRATVLQAAELRLAELQPGPAS
jgi:hypothetical protein